MYCPNCACELPSVAKFCVRCGHRVEHAFGYGAVPPETHLRLFCVNCGRPYEQTDVFCNNCGRPISHPDPAGTTQNPALSATKSLSGEEGIPNSVNPEGALAGDNSESTCAGVNRGVSIFNYLLALLGCIVSAATVSLFVADDLARQHWTDVLLLAGAVIFGAGCLSWFWSVDRRVRKQARSDGSVLSQRRRILVNVAVFMVMFLAASSGIGYQIGVSGSETNQLFADIALMRTIGQRISAQRDSAARTVPAQIRMYESIASDVQQFASVADRLQAEIEIYDLKYPAQHSTTEDVIRDIKVASQRAALLRRQVDLAKQLELLGDDERWSLWSRQMQPLLDQEDSLSH